MPLRDNIYVLAIDTSTNISSIGVSCGNKPLVSIYVDRGVVKGENLFLLIDKLLGEAGIGKSDLGGIAVGVGPGSFTGIRIALSIAKSMSYAGNLLVKGIVTMDAIACEFEGISLLVSPLISAASGKYFTALYSVKDGLKRVEDVSLCNLKKWLQFLAQKYRDREILFILDERRRADSNILLGASNSYNIVVFKMFPKTDALVKLFYTHMLKEKLDDPFSILPLYYRASAAEEKISK